MQRMQSGLGTQSMNGEMVVGLRGLDMIGDYPVP